MRYQAWVLLGNTHHICHLMRGCLLCSSNAMSTWVPKHQLITSELLAVSAGSRVVQGREDTIMQQGPYSFNTALNNLLKWAVISLCSTPLH